MAGFILGAAANRRIDEIVDYTRRLWGDLRTIEYMDGLFAAFASIAADEVPSTPIPSELGVPGFRRRYRHHFIYWKRTSTGEIAIMTILHQRMEQGLHRDEIGAG